MVLLLGHAWNLLAWVMHGTWYVLLTWVMHGTWYVLLAWVALNTTLHILTYTVVKIKGRVSSKIHLFFVPSRHPNDA